MYDIMHWLALVGSKGLYIPLQTTTYPIHKGQVICALPHQSWCHIQQILVLCFFLFSTRLESLQYTMTRIQTRAHNLVHKTKSAIQLQFYFNLSVFNYYAYITSIA